jgi:hypothetical protein
MIDREKVIKGFEVCLKNIDQPDCPNDCPYLSDCSKYENRVVFQPLMRDALALIKEQDAEISRISNAYLELVGKASKQPNVVRCKDCKHRGDRHKCIVAFVVEKQEMPYFFYDNRGEWYCADGERRCQDDSD